MATKRPVRRRAPLTRERVLQSAVKLADERGIDAVSMRKLGQVLRVEAMSLYKYVADKDDLLDGMADLVTAGIEVPRRDPDWRTAIRGSAISVHEALQRHPWAAAVFESRLSPGPARLRYLDAVIGVLRDAGFSLPMVARAFMALDSHTYGFALQEASWPFEAADSQEVAATMAASPAAREFPNLLAMAEVASSEAGVMVPDFEFGLDLILDGLDRLAGSERG